MALPQQVVDHLNRRHNGAYTPLDSYSVQLTGAVDAQLLAELDRAARVSKCEVKLVSGVPVVTVIGWTPSVSGAGSGSTQATVLPQQVIDHLNRRHAGAYSNPDGNSARLTGNVDGQLLVELLHAAAQAKCEVKLVNGVLVVTMPNWTPSVSQLRVVTDNFNRADGDPGANWNEMVTDGGLTILSNKIKAGGVDGHRGAFWNDTFSSHQYSQMVIGATALAEGDFLGPAVRCQNNMNDFYTLMFFNVSGGGGSDWELWLYKRVAGGFAGAGGGFLAMGMHNLVNHPAAGDILRIEATGNIIAGYVNGVLKISAYDTSVPAGGSPGLFFYQHANAITADNFEGGELSYTPPGQVAAVTEDFNSISAMEPSLNWASLLGRAASISASQATSPAASSTPYGACWINGDFANNQASQCEARETTVNSGWIGVTVRDDVGADNNYLAIYIGSTIALYRTAAGAFTQLGSNYAVPGGFHAGDVLRLEASGTTLTVKLNGNAVITQTDATYSSGRPGFRVVQTGNLLDNWRGESI